jgi:hypothetical protein
MVGFAAFIFKYGADLRAGRASSEMATKSDLTKYQFGPGR